jgi:tetratricopeptide (TPR) repeat protein
MQALSRTLRGAALKRVCLWRISLGLALCLASSASAQLPDLHSGGHFLTDDDSLGYDEFRQLPAEAQLRARSSAQGWLSWSRDAVSASGGRDGISVRRRPAYAKTPDESRAALERAFDCAATAVGYCPYMAEAWIQYADVAMRLGQNETSVACIAHARKTINYERDEDVRQRNFLELERIRALSSYNVNDFDAALEAAQFVIAHSEGEWELRLLAARCMIQADRFADARRLMTSFPDDRLHYATALSLLGVAELEQGNYEAAEDAFDQAAEKGLIDSIFENDRGRLYLETGKYHRAARHFRRSTELNPLFREAACNVGVAQKRGGDLADAEATFDALLLIAPDYAPAHFNLAEVYREHAAASGGGNRERLARLAWTQYNLALAFGAPPDQVITRRATLSVVLDDLDSAEADLLSLTADPTVSVHVLTVLARVKKDQGRLDIAEQILEMATQRDDATAMAFAELGEVRLRRKNYSAAREALQIACAMDTALVVSRVNLSIACDALGDMKAAWAALDEAIAIDPMHPLVLQRIEDQTRPRS